MTYAELLRPTNDRTALLYDVALIVAGSWFIAAMARLTLEIGPVPVTGQTLAVLLIGVLLGSRKGALSVLAYIAQGIAGLPVFARGLAGPAIVASPTFGYIMGFVAAAFVVGLLAERNWDANVLKTAAAMIVGNLIIYAFGVAWLAILNVPEVIAVGVVPFLLGDALKIGLAMVLLPLGWRLVGSHHTE
ncbi:MAG: biotin transporter BioY [Chloroflexi bacterium]|nr:biotin transporter BioY [Chloroflexota bacterium]